MAFEQDLVCRSYKAAADLSTKQFFFMSANSSDQVNVPTVAGQQVTGVLQDDPAAANRAANVAIRGVSKVVAGGTCTVGSLAATTSAGKAVNAVSGDMALGRFRTGTTAADTIVSVELEQFGKIW